MMKHHSFDMLNLSDFCEFLVVDYIRYLPKAMKVATCPKILP